MVIHPRPMAFKRSAVRSRLSPPTPARHLLCGVFYAQNTSSGREDYLPGRMFFKRQYCQFFTGIPGKKGVLENERIMKPGPFPRPLQPHPQSAPGTPHHREWVLQIHRCRKDTRNREPDCHAPCWMFARLFRDKPL